jgi:DNA-binding protein H-NS
MAALKNSLCMVASHVGLSKSTPISVEFIPQVDGIAGTAEAGQNHVWFLLEGTMPKPNLSRMDVESLANLRKQVDELLLKRRADIEAQLGTLAALSGERGTRRGRGVSVLRGKKVPPKYRGPAGETWAGRGARPRWLVAATARGTGKKVEDFLIDKSAAKASKKRKPKG